MFGRRIVEFLHKRTSRTFSLLAFGERWFLSLHWIQMPCFKLKKLEAQWAEPVSLTFHSALRKLKTEPFIGCFPPSFGSFG
jgi:hypothetical protein